MRTNLLLLLLLLPALFLKAQDIHLSQFYTNNQNLNPGLAGQYEGLYQVSANYRNQWRQVGDAPLTTAMVGINHKFYFGNDEISAGILVAQDQFSGYNLNTSKIIVGGSYFKRLNSHELSAGIQAGLTLKSTDLSRQTFPNQWAYQDGIFDRNINNMESGLNESYSFFDINLGFAWSRTYSNFTPQGGVAFFHLNTPESSYLEDKDASLGVRTVVHGSILLKRNSSYSFQPRFLLMMESKAQDALFGGNVYKNVESETISKIHFGLLYRDGFGRNSDAVIPVVGLNYKNFEMGMSYDFNVGELSNQGRAKSTFELSLVYIAPAFVPEKLTIPCSRY